MRLAVVLTNILLAALLISGLVLADDTEIYTDVSACATVNQEKYRFVFIVDNSGSMSSWEFTQSRNTIRSTIREVLESDLDDIQVAVVQYGTNHFTREHKYDVTVPFTSDVVAATSWTRHFGPGSPRYWDLQDHQPASLKEMREDNVWAAGGALDVSDATNVQIVFFTDALRDFWGGCCSSLVNTGSPNHNLGSTLPGFDEYNVLKNGSVLPNGLKAQFTILHVPPGGSWYAPASRAAAAIASPGGNYTGDVEWNPGDPEGPGSKPRRYVQGSFSVSDASKILELIRQVIEEVKGITYTNVAPAISVNAFNQLQHRNELYYAIFQPKLSARWQGNIKKFKITSEGELQDANGNPAIDPSSGSISDDAQSFWSDVVDGSEVELGGVREQLTASREVYTDAYALAGGGSGLHQIQTDSDISFEALGLGTTSTGGLCVEAADRNGETITANTFGVEAETDLPVDGGSAVRLSFTTTDEIRAEVRVTRSSGGPVLVCEGTYSASPDAAHQCEENLPANATAISLYFETASGSGLSSTVEYMLEYNLTSGSVPTVCADLESKRTQLLSWLTGQDVYNDDGDTLFTDPTHYTADPLHAQPFVITYSGSSASNAKDVLFSVDNLGMLHAIDPADNKGTEKWSYLPAEHLDNLRDYAGNKAGAPKVYGLDGYISVLQREAAGSTPSNFSLDEVTLFIGERRGGRNYYSIDVSDAHTSISQPSVNWKIIGSNDSRFSDLGQTWSAMLPRKIKTNCSALGKGCVEHEVVVFSGGYDPANDDSSRIPSDTLGNAIYIVDLETGGDRFFWSAGNNSDARASHNHNLNLDIEHSMPASPMTVDTDGDGAIDLIFGIDIAGNIWRIDFDPSKSAGSSQWASGGKIARLNENGDLRRFYNTPDISRTNPRSGRDSFVLVVGSGFRAHPNDRLESDNRLYVVFDPYTKRRRLSGGDESLRYKYISTGASSARMIEFDDLDEAGSLSILPEHGFYKNMTANGEKILQRSITFNNTIIVSSFIPTEEGSEECAVGNGRTYFLNLADGSSVFADEFVELVHPGIPPEATILHLPKIAVCIGTECVAAEETPSGDDTDSDPCDPSGFDAGSHGSALAAAVSATTCGMEKGRAFRAEWREN